MNESAPVAAKRCGDRPFLRFVGVSARASPATGVGRLAASFVPLGGDQEEAMKAQDQGVGETNSTSMRICPECGEEKDSARFLATIDGQTCRLAICFNCRAEQSKRFHRVRKKRREEVKH